MKKTKHYSIILVSTYATIINFPTERFAITSRKVSHIYPSPTDNRNRITHNQPIHPLIQALPINRGACDYTPIPIPELPQSQRLGYLPRPLCARLILLVREDQERRIS